VRSPLGQVLYSADLNDGDIVAALAVLASAAIVVVDVGRGVVATMLRGVHAGDAVEQPLPPARRQLPVGGAYESAHAGSS
jgi:hypothetical protein